MKLRTNIHERLRKKINGKSTDDANTIFFQLNENVYTREGFKTEIIKMINNGQKKEAIQFVKNQAKNALTAGLPAEKAALDLFLKYIETHDKIGLPIKSDEKAKPIAPFSDPLTTLLFKWNDITWQEQLYECGKLLKQHIPACASILFQTLIQCCPEDKWSHEANRQLATLLKMDLALEYKTISLPPDREDFLLASVRQIEHDLKQMIEQFSRCYPFRPSQFTEHLQLVRTQEYCTDKKLGEIISATSPVKPEDGQIALAIALTEYELYKQFRTRELCFSSVTAFQQSIPLISNPSLFPWSKFLDILQDYIAHKITGSFEERQQLKNLVAEATIRIKDSTQQEHFITEAKAILTHTNKTLEERKKFATAFLQQLSPTRLNKQVAQTLRENTQKINTIKKANNSLVEKILQTLREKNFLLAIELAAHSALNMNLGVEMLPRILNLFLYTCYAKKEILAHNRLYQTLHQPVSVDASTETKIEPITTLTTPTSTSESKEPLIEIEIDKEKIAEEKRRREEVKLMKQAEKERGLYLKKRQKRLMKLALAASAALPSTSVSTVAPFSPSASMLASTSSIENTVSIQDFLRDRAAPERLSQLLELFKKIETIGGHIWIKGTTVSALVIGVPRRPNDLDISIRGIPAAQLSSIVDFIRESKMTVHFPPTSRTPQSFQSIAYDLGDIICQMTVETEHYSTKDFIPLTSQTLPLQANGQIHISPEVRAFFKAQNQTYSILPDEKNRAFLMRSLKHDFTYVELHHFKRDISVINTIGNESWLISFLRSRWNTPAFDNEIIKLNDWAREFRLKTPDQAATLKTKISLILKALTVVVFEEIKAKLTDDQANKLESASLLQKMIGNELVIQSMTERLFDVLIVAPKSANSMLSLIITAFSDDPAFLYIKSQGKTVCDKEFIIPLIKLLTPLPASPAFFSKDKTSCSSSSIATCSPRPLIGKAMEQLK